jgi:hypothetical protein
MNLRAGESRKEKRGKSAYKARVLAMEQASKILLCIGEPSYPERGLGDKSQPFDSPA